MSEPKQSCGVCRFFLVDDQDKARGMCRRHPPTPLPFTDVGPPPKPGEPPVMTHRIYAHFPDMHPDIGWCGDFEPQRTVN